MKQGITDSERKIIDVFADIIPQLTELEKEKLLSFGEGIAAFKGMQQHTQEDKYDSAEDAD